MCPSTTPGRGTKHTLHQHNFIYPIIFEGQSELCVFVCRGSVPLQAPGPIPPGIRIRLDEHEAPPPPPKGFIQKYVSLLRCRAYHKSTSSDLEARVQNG